MPWNDKPGVDGDKGGPKGGPWGDGRNQPKSPWGAPGGGRDDKGPDLEEMMRRLQGRVRGNGPPGAGRFQLLGPSGFLIAGALLFAAWLGSGVFIVSEGESGVVSRFGAYNRLAGPGLHVHLPAPIETVDVLAVSQQRQTTVGFEGDKDRPEESLMLTRDEAIVDIDFTVIWQLTDKPQDFLFNVRFREGGGRSDDLVLAVAESAMREVVGQSTLESVISRDRAVVANRTRELMQQMLSQYQAGVRIVEVRLQSATAPEEVIQAFNDVDRAKAEAASAINNAEARASSIIQDAEGYRERVAREAAGEAARFNLIYDEYRLNPRVTRERLYLETMERVLGGADKVIVDGRAGVTPYLPLDQLRKSAPQGETKQ